MCKTKFVSLRHLETALTYKHLRLGESLINIPYFYCSETDNGYSLNVFDEKGTFNYRNIKYVNITCIRDILLKLQLNDYIYNGYEIKLEAPDINFENTGSVEMSSITIPIKMFKIILLKSKYRDNCKSISTDISNILLYTASAYSIKLLDKNRKLLAYAVQN